MGFTEDGAQVVPTARHQANRWAEIGQQAARSVTLIDLCGHERYLKTTVFGLTGGVRWGMGRGCRRREGLRGLRVIGTCGSTNDKPNPYQH